MSKITHNNLNKVEETVESIDLYAEVRRLNACIISMKKEIDSNRKDAGTKIDIVEQKLNKLEVK